MPLYEFRCPDCGPFDLRRDMQEAGQAVDCPSCGRPAQRRYTVAPGRPSTGLLRGAETRDRARVDRARSGEPVVTGPPSGRRFPRSRGHHH